MAISNGKMVPFATVDGARKSTDQYSADVFDVGYLRDQNTIGKKITEARKTNKISQKELASRLEEYGSTDLRVVFFDQNIPCLDEFLGGQQALLAELLKHRQAEPVALFPLKHAHVHH